MLTLLDSESEVNALCDDPYVSYDAYHISLNTILFSIHSLYHFLSCETATSAG